MSSRRHFLTAALVGGSLSAARRNTPGASDRVRLGLIGCGGIAKVDLRTFLGNPEVECNVVCDVDDSRLTEAVALVEELRNKRPEGVKDFRQVIDRSDVDICLICTPDHWHALPMVYACQAGKDVYVEKPLAVTIPEGRAMVEAAARHKRVVQMGTQFRSSEVIREGVEFVQSGKLGKIRQARAWAHIARVGNIGNPPDGDPPPGVDYDMWLGPAPKRPFNPNRFHFNFRLFWDYAGGMMTDFGAHLINVVLWAMGYTAPRAVTSFGGKYVVSDNSETPDTQVTIYEFPAFVLVWEHQEAGGIGLYGRDHGVAFYGSEATLVVDRRMLEVIPESQKKNQVAAVRREGPDVSRSAHVRNFLDCVRDRRQPVMHPEVSHYASSVSHLGNLALRSGAKVAWDPKTGQVHGAPTSLVNRSYRAPWSLPYMVRV